MPPKGHVARLHIVTGGHGWVQVEGQSENVPIANGDLVIIPHGAGHIIRGAPDTPPRMLDDVLSDVNYPGNGPLIYGGNGPSTRLVCGELGFDDAIHPLITDLPPLLYVSSKDSRSNMWLDSTLSLIAHEAITNQTGSLAILNRLAEIIFIQTIRALANAPETKIPFLAALNDPQISLALGAIHRQPAAYFTIEKLGKIAGMSRSSFSNRFSELVGMTPYQYLTLTRMQLASRALSASNEPLMAISESVGYQSEAAFSTAFKRFFGVRPGEYRKQQGASTHGTFAK